MSSNTDYAFDSLIDCHQSLLIEVTILLHFAEEHVTSEALDGKVELVAPHVATYSLHGVVGPILTKNSLGEPILTKNLLGGPVLELGTVDSIVVFDGIESLLEDLSV